MPSSRSPAPPHGGRGRTAAPSDRPIRLERLERLEDRSVPALLLGLTTGNTLVQFDSSTPGTVISTVAVTGLGGDALVGIDFRPATGQLYGVGSSSRLYTIDPMGGAATPVGAAFTPALSGTGFGVDFNPVPDRLRVVSGNGQNLRINPTTGTATADTNLAYDSADENAGQTPNVVAAAYTNNFAGAPNTTLYAIDAARDQLVTIGGPGDDPASPSPNSGTLFTVMGGPLGFDATDQTAFDITPSADPLAPAFATGVSGGTTTLYAVNLTTGIATAVGAVGGGVALTGIAVLPPQTGAGAFRLSAPSFTFNESGSVTITVSRVGGATGTVTVNYATADGTARAGVDYAPVMGTLMFDAGVTTQTITVAAIPDTSGIVGDSDKTFTLALSNPTGGAALGSPATVTLTISEAGPPNSPPPPVSPLVPTPPPVPGPVPPQVVTRYFAVGAGDGGSPVVKVYTAATSQLVRSFFAYDPSFRNGVNVATGDVNGDGVDDIVAGAGVGGGPAVEVFDGATGAQLYSFFAYESSFRGGVIVAVGDVNGDGFDDIIAGSGVGGGPAVQVFDGSTSNRLFGFFAFDSSFRNGVNVAVGEFTGDSNADIVAASGPGGGPQVGVFDGVTQQVLATFFAEDQAFRGGVNIATGLFGTQGIASIVTGAGPGGASSVKVFPGLSGTASSTFMPFPAGFTGGARVATIATRGDGRGLILVGPGTGGDPTVQVIDPSTGSSAPGVTAFEPSFRGGVFVG